MRALALALALVAQPLSASETVHSLFDGVAEITLPERYAPALARDDFVSFETAPLIATLTEAGQDELLKELQSAPLPFADPAPQTPEDCPEKLGLTSHPLCRPASVIFLHHYDLTRTEHFFKLERQLSYGLDSFQQDWLGANTEGILNAYCTGGQYNRVETKRSEGDAFAHVECYETEAAMPVLNLTRLAITSNRRETAVSITGMIGDSFSPLAYNATSEAEMIEAFRALNTDAARTERLAEFERVFESFRLTDKALSE